VARAIRTVRAPAMSKRFASAAAQTNVTLKRDWLARYGISVADGNNVI